MASPSQNIDVERGDSISDFIAADPEKCSVQGLSSTEKPSGLGIIKVEDPYLVSDLPFDFNGISPLPISGLLYELTDATHLTLGYLGWPR